MKKLKRILLDDFEQLSEAEAAQCVGGCGQCDPSWDGGGLITTTSYNSFPYIPPVGGSTSSNWGGNHTSSFGGGSGTVHYNSHGYGVSGTIGSSFGNYSWNVGASYGSGGVTGGVSYGSNGWTTSGSYTNCGVNINGSYNSNSGWTAGVGYSSSGFKVNINYNSNSGMSGSVSYTLTL